MEDEEECKKSVHESASPQQDIGFTMEDKPLDTVVEDVHTTTGQCEFFPELADSEPFVSNSSVEAQNDDPAVAEKYVSPLVVSTSPVGAAEDAEDVAVFRSDGVETKAAEVDKVENEALEMPESSSHDTWLIVGDKDVEVAVKETGIPTDCSEFVRARDGEVAEAEGEASAARGEMENNVEVKGEDESQLVGVNEVSADEIPQVGRANEVETKSGCELETSVGKFVSELDDSKLDELEGGLSKVEPGLDESELPDITSPIPGGVVVDGSLQGGNEMELENEVETKELGSSVGEFVSEFKDSRLLGVEGGVSKSEPGLDESELADVKSPVAGAVVVDGSLEGANVMELENEVETKGLGSSGAGEFVSEVGDLQLLGVGSSVATKNDEDEGVVIKGESGMEDTEMDMELEAEVTNEGGSTSVPLLDNSHSVDGENDVGTEAEDEAPMVDTEMETETEVGESPEADKGVSGGGKRKRGKVTKVLAKPPPRKKVIGEDVCFICFDGGDMVLCDRRGCPKAYHPSCVNRDEAFFRAKGRWNCGWHLCSHCEKNAHYMCYTCTFSLCKTCIKEFVFFRVRTNKGFCETCMKTVMLIENNERASKEDRVNFDDKSSWEYLFKDYWEDLKAKLSLSADELAEAKNPWKGSDVLAGKQESPEEVFDATNDRGSGSESSENVVTRKSKRKAKKKSKSLTKEEDLPSSRVVVDAGGTSLHRNSEWASTELLEFVMHMKNGDDSVLSQFDVQALLLEYIKRNKLRDPRKKSQIICDSRLGNLFGKARVGHFEMLKLLESHFLVKEDSQPDDVQGSVVDTVVNHLEADEIIDAPRKGSKDRRRKMRRKDDLGGPQSNLGDYAAIDIHNISLIYLRRKLVEDLLEDLEKFHDKVFGTFVRIRISGSTQNQDMYRLVQVVGTRKAAELYKVGKKVTDLVLEILNLNKTEVVSIDTVSNQEFTEDECKRLRQSIKCGLIERLTVGDILDKAMEIQEARVNDWLETETVRLSHLRDRASDLGRKKELRECVEKLQLLKTPEERMRRLEEVPKIHADPKMDPSYESEEEDTEMEDNKQETYPSPRGSGFSRKGREPNSPHRGNFSPIDSGSSTRTNSGKNWDTNRNMSNKGFPIKSEEATVVGEIKNENVRNQGRDKEANTDKVHSGTNYETIGRDSRSFAKSESFSGAAASETSQASLAAAGVAETAIKINETEKMWHYQDPAGKIQGPFSLVQLRKWNSNGYFPVDLRIWKTTEKQDNSLLLTDALAGRFFQKKELLPIDNNFSMPPQTVRSPHLSSTHAGKPYGASLHHRKEGGEGGIRSQVEPSSSSGWATPSVEVPKASADRLVTDYSRNESTNLPSPTPMSSTPRWTGGKASESKWSSNSAAGVNSFPGGNGPTQSPPVATSVSSGQFSQSGSKEHAAVESFGVSTPLSVSSSSLMAPRSEQQGASQTIVTSGGHGIQHSVETQQWGPGSVQTQEMGAVPHQNTGTETTQAWGGAAAQNSEANPSLPAYGQWGAVPTIQNPTGNFSAPVFSAFPQPDPWRPPAVANNQSNIQPAAAPNVPWGMGVAPNNAFVPAQNNVNTVWVPMPGNPNMGWVGPAPGATNMNWGAPVQGTVNQGWVATTGNPGAMVQGILPGNVNQSWAPQTGNPGSGIPQAGNPGSGMQPGNGNPGWVAPTGNPGFNVQGQAPGNVNPAWGTPTGNPGPTTVPVPAAPGNANPGWGPPAPGNNGMRGNDKQHNGNNRFSGQRDRGGFGGSGRWNNRQSSGGGQRPPNTICPFHQNGHCRKGAHCDMLHK